MIAYKMTTPNVKMGCYKNPFNMETSPEWYCECCKEWHQVKSRRALVPFAKFCGFNWIKTDDDGDCFYKSISLALKSGITVYDQRVLVSESFSAEQYEFYILQAQMGGDEYNWAVNLLQEGVLDDITSIKDFILVEGRLNHGDCVWADQFAINIIGMILNINILFVDMDRNKNESPYRWLYKSDDKHSEYIVLKRQRNHYQPLQYNDGTSRWRKDELPSVIEALWL